MANGVALQGGALAAPWRPAAWLLAAVVTVLAPVLMAIGVERGTDALFMRVQRAAEATLAPGLRQRSIPQPLVEAARAMLADDALGLNYLTLRNANGVVVVSLGSYEGLADFLSGGQARHVRGWLYQATSAETRFALHRDGQRVGYVDAGVGLFAAAAQAPAFTGLGLLLFIAALAGLVFWWPDARAFAEQRRQDGQVGAPARAVAAKVAPRPAPKPDAQNPLLEALGLGLLSVDHRQRIVSVNGVGQRILGRDAASLRGQPADQVLRLTGAHGETAPAPLSDCLRRRERVSARRWLQREGRDALALDLVATTATESVKQAACVLFWPVVDEAPDVAQRETKGPDADRAPVAALPSAPSAQARDPLTGLARYAAFVERAQPLLDTAARAGAVLAVLAVDIRGFGRINREFGRAQGDAALAAIAQRLQTALPDAEAARLGGDQFALALPVAAAPAALALAQQLQNAFATPVRVTGLELPVALDIGVSAGPQDADRSEALLVRAEAALAAARRSGDHAPRAFVPEMEARPSVATDAAGVLYQALIGDALRLSLWPVRAGHHTAAALAQVDFPDALATPASGPSLFALAAECGLAAELTAWALRRLAREIAAWRDIGMAPPLVVLDAGVELGASQVVARAWKLACEQYHIAPGGLALTLPPGARAPGGLAVATVTDFSGAPPEGADVLLLAAATIARLPDADALAAAKALAGFAKKRGSRVLAGPVTDEAQAAALARAGIEAQYGPQIAPAMPARAFGRSLARHPPPR